MFKTFKVRLPYLNECGVGSKEIDCCTEWMNVSQLLELRTRVKYGNGRIRAVATHLDRMMGAHMTKAEFLREVYFAFVRHIEQLDLRKTLEKSDFYQRLQLWLGDVSLGSSMEPYTIHERVDPALGWREWAEKARAEDLRIGNPANYMG